MFEALIFDYAGTKLETVTIDAQTFEDAERRAARYANENQADWDHLAVNRVKS